MEKILNLREFERKQAENELAAALSEETRIKAELEILARNKVQAVKNAEGETDFFMLAELQKYLQLVGQKTDALLEELAQANLVTEQKRELLRQAMQKENVLEKLKEKRMEQWLSEKKKSEEKELDDISTNMFRRK